MSDALSTGPVPSGSRALVLTVSDGVAASTRQDESGVVLADRLALAGFRVDRVAVADDRVLVEHAIRNGATDHVLIVSTGGTGLTPRDVTPQATLAVIDYEVPGLAEAMRAAGRAKTPMADLSRGVVGVIGRSLVINVPGSPRAALESLAAIEPTLAHALETLAGPFEHGTSGSSGAGDVPRPDLLQPRAAVETTYPLDRAGDASGDLYGDPPLPDASDEWRDLPDAGRT
jgi:molybdenum cofactor synthesis domain-containing protein